MAVYETTINSAMAPPEAFAYMADFSNAAEWDPGVAGAERLDDEVEEGSRFRLRVEFLGRELELTYELTTYEPDSRIVLRAENATAVSEDTITIEPGDRGRGSRVHYHADLRLKGPFRFGDPLLGLAFDRIGDRAAAGLEQALGGVAAGV